MTIDTQEPRRIGKIVLDEHRHPRAVLETGYDEHGDQWKEGTPIYAATVAAHKVDMDSVLAWQEAQGIRQPADSRESRMVVLRHNTNGKPTVWCDPEIADLVDALNNGNLATVASCSGHGKRPGSIILSDGRELIIAKDFDEARAVERCFPGVNGEPPVAAQAQPCNHVYEAMPIDGTTRASAQCEPVCRKCWYRPASKAANGGNT